MTIVSLGEMKEEWICSGNRSAKSKNSRLIIFCMILLGMAGAPGIAEIKGSEAGIGVARLLDITWVVIVVVVTVAVVVRLGAADMVLLERAGSVGSVAGAAMIGSPSAETNGGGGGRPKVLRGPSA